MIRLYEADGRVSKQSFALGSAFLGKLNDRFTSQQTFLDNVLRGLIKEPLKQVGTSFAAALHSQLFKYNLQFRYCHQH